MNNLFLIGRVIKLPDIVTMKVKIETKENCIFNIELSPNLMKNIVDYIKEGDLIGIKAHLDTTEFEEIKIICDKLTFLSQSKGEN